MLKRTQFLGSDSGEVRARGIFTDAFEKTAFGVTPSDDWHTADEIRSYIRTITAADRKKYCYVLVNALGAGEYFGSNINADYFPWNALCHEGEDYGYKTFLKAHAFAHHVNKDPAKSFGVPVLSVLNHRMKRVELIIRLDREKARELGQDGIIKRIDDGEFPDVSMGCKVPYDVCSICGNRSKTRNDYCVHMNPPPELRHIYGPNKILPDGRKIYVINLHPRFFDISFVFIGADKTAKVMAKLASVNGRVCLGNVCTLSMDSAQVSELVDEGLVEVHFTEKTASACCDSCATSGGACEEGDGFDKLAEAFGVKTATRKVAAHQKLSEIIKSVPTSQFALKRLPSLESEEPDIPNHILDQMADHGVSNACTTPMLAGMLLKPREFQRIVVVRMGMPDLADDLDHQGVTFRQVGGFDQSMELGDSPVAGILRLLADLIDRRTAFGDRFQYRSSKVLQDPKKSLPTGRVVKDPLLDKISAAYNGYRRSMLMKIAQAAETVRSDPRLREMVLGQNLTSVFSKMAGNDRLLSHDSMTYFAGAHLQDRGLLTTTAVAVSAAVANSGLSEEL